MKKQYIYGLLATLIWATMATAVKMAVGSLPKMEVLSVCALIAGGFLLIVNVVRGTLPQLLRWKAKDYASIIFLGFLGMFLYSAFYYLGLEHLSAQEGCIINYLWPVMTVLFSAVLLREKLTFLKITAMLCSFGGVVILTIGGSTAAGGNRILGIAASLLSAALYGLFSVLNKKYNYDQSLSMMVIWLSSGIFAAVYGVFTETWVPITASQWPGLIWIGIMTDAAAYLFWALAVNGSKDSAAIANLAYLTPFISMVISSAMLGEKIRLQAVFALVLIIGGILLQSVPFRKLRPKFSSGRV